MTTTPQAQATQPTALPPDVIESVRLLHGDAAADALAARGQS